MSWQVLLIWPCHFYPVWIRLVSGPKCCHVFCSCSQRPSPTDGRQCHSWHRQLSVVGLWCGRLPSPDGHLVTVRHLLSSTVIYCHLLSFTIIHRSLEEDLGSASILVLCFFVFVTFSFKMNEFKIRSHTLFSSHTKKTGKGLCSYVINALRLL